MICDLILRPIRNTLVLLAYSVLFLWNSPSFGSAFQLWEQDAAGVGDAHAGAAAKASDASTAYYNPAGMMQLAHPQIVLGNTTVLSHIAFDGTVSGNFGDTKTGLAQAGVIKEVPDFHMVMPLSDKLALGLSLVAPFGGATQYAKASIAQEDATTTEVTVIDVSPAIAFRFDNHVSLGAGIDFESITAKFDNAVFDTFPDQNRLSGHHPTWHAGLLYELSPKSRLGVAYHASNDFHLSGLGTMSTLSGEIQDQSAITTAITLPASTELSAYHQFNQHYAGLVSLTYTQWHSFQNLALRHLPDGTGEETLDVNIPTHYKNTFNLALGLHYFPTEPWIVRLGLAYDQTPSSDRYRTIRLPDQDRVTVAAGVGYRWSPVWRFDFGMSHLFVKSAKINTQLVEGSSEVTTTGHVNSRADLIGLQITWNFLS